MKQYIKKVLKKIMKTSSKQQEEMAFWIHEQINYGLWYKGELRDLYGVPAPSEKQKIRVHNLKDSAILTWHRLHQEPKYLNDLDINRNSFKGLKVLDVGAGPIPSATVYGGADLYCLDQLYGQYMQIGYPLHYYNGVSFINAGSEDIPVDNHFFDAVISLNAIDHVDDLHASAQEIKRVLKPGGKFAMHVHYHKKTPTEPIELNDEIFLQEFGWVKSLKKVKTSKVKKGSVAGDDEAYVLWRNF